MSIRCVISFVLGAFAACAVGEDLVIGNVTLIDGTGAAARSGAWVHVEDGVVAAIGDQAPETDARTVDGSGLYLIPGLMDMHIHLRGGVRTSPEGLRERASDRKEGIRALHGYLYSGVTSIYDAGNNPDYIMRLRDDERAAKIDAPRIFATGGIVTYPGSHGSGAGATTVDDWPEAIEALEAHVARKPDVVKLTYEERGWGSRPMIPRLPIDLMQRIVEFYNDRGIRTTVHTSSELRARQAIFAGVDTLAHPVIQGPVTEAFARLMGAKRVPMVTTLTIGENYSRLAESPEYLDQPLYRATLGADEIETLKGETRRAYQERPWTWWMQIMTDIAQENLRMIHEQGGVLVLGTDQSLGPAVHRELELLAAAGISNAEILKIATFHGAVFLGEEHRLGTIEVGKLADMVLLEADPLEDITNARKIRAVFKNGEEIDRGALDLPVNE